MISVDLARRLRRAGLPWCPASGDVFQIPDRDLDDQLFVISELVVEVHELPGGRRLLKFNGTTEWALDSLDAAEALWLPREDQLRAMLGDAFVELRAAPGGFVVVLERAGAREQHVDLTAANAYARAVLAVLDAR